MERGMELEGVQSLEGRRVASWEGYGFKEGRELRGMWRLEGHRVIG